MKMKNTQETDIHITSGKHQDNDQVEASKNTVHLKALPLETRMEEASKPLYLSRYE